MTVSQKILVGLALGVAAGLALGERAAPLQVIAQGFVRLLQMTVLPYITVSLIVGIGRLDAKSARQLFLKVGTITLLVWGLALAAVFAMPLAFPTLESASFFSTTVVEERPAVDFLALYIPANPFHSLADSVVPAVVLFSVLLGIALMGVEHKQGLIDALSAAERALARANHMVARLTPLGLFAIAAHTLGTMDLAEVARLRVFQLSYATMAALLALVVFPGLVACLTPVPVLALLGSMRNVFVTAFVTGDLFIVLPALIERSKDLLRRHGGVTEAEAESPDVIVPAFYNFPHAAKMLSLSFVLFAAWFSETTLAPSAYPRLAAAGVLSLFGSLNVAIPFLLDFARVPADTFQLFLASSVLNARFGALAAASHMVVLAIVGSWALHGRLRPRAPQLLRYLVTTAGVSGAALLSLALALRALGGGQYEGARLAHEMGLLNPPSPGASVLATLPAAPADAPAGTPLLAAVRERGRIRIGFFPAQRPYSHFNARGELVGFDVEMAHALARELRVAAEFAPVPRDELVEALEAGCVDVVMSGVLLTTLRASRVDFSTPYLDETLAFVTPDHRRADFSDAAWVRAREGLRIGVPDLPYLEDLPLAYPVARHDVEAARFMSVWIELKKRDGTIQALYDHWILGRGATAGRARPAAARAGHGGED